SNEELARADRRKDEFLAMLAHELRNPLAPILTGLEVMVGSPGDTKTVEQLATMMRRQMSQMVHLIDDLLDISRINTGKISLKQEDIRLLPVLEEAIESVRPLIGSSGHRFTFHMPDKGTRLTGDPHRLSQIVSNLLSNAAKYTPAGGIIEMSVSTSGGQAHITVRDNGEGISAADLDRIFGLFQQINPSRQDGLGLGLTLVKNLVELHGGTISASSGGPGMGSSFTVQLPMLPTGPELESDQPASAPVTTKPVQQKRVMVVDDGKSTVQVISLFLQMEGMQTSVAYDGEEAIRIASEFKPDMVFMDLGMPKMNGFEAARHLRAAHPDALLIALSGWGRDEDRIKSKEAGFDGHAVKPVAPDDLRKYLAMLG
ncbi:MAG: hybrid sensor histidine kinase/response regulator, partial [Verrucomicrobiaceae bacterium]